MALTKKQIAMIDSCPVLKSMKSELIAVLGEEEEEVVEDNSSSQTDSKRDISVTVDDGTNPVNGASVVLSKGVTSVANGTTGSTGGCTLSNVDDDTYTITVTKEGFTDYTDSVTTSKTNASLTITLTAITSTP